jgi:hypothetical protein
MKIYSRAGPSPRYQRLLALYRAMRLEGEVHLGIPPDQTLPGKSLPPQAGHIKRLVDLTGAKTILDYGSGKGGQYLPMPRQDDGGTVHLGIAAWWGAEVRCYNPGYAKFAELPAGRFDGVISTDVLERCPEEHCTIRPLRWWRQVVEQAARAHPGLLYEFRLQLDERGPGGPQRVEEVLTNREAWAGAAPAAA